MLINPYNIYLKRKFIINFNYNAAITYYNKYRNYITSDLYSSILKLVFKRIKYLYTLLDIVIK